MNLEESLNKYIAEVQDVDEERFVIDSDEKADWALRKIAEAENEIEKVEYFAETQIRQIENWKAKQTEKHNNSIEYFKSLLAEYLHNKRKENPKLKSITLPTGNVGFRKKPVKWVYNDEVVLKTLESENLDDFIKIEKKLDKQSIKKAFEVVNGKVINPETGQVIEGIEIQEQGESLNVRLNK